MRHHPGGLLAGLAATAIALSAIPANAQLSGDGYLFGRPDLTITLNGGFTRPSADSEIFGFVTDMLTVGRGDFSAFAAGTNLSFTVGPRLALGASIGYSGRTTNSEYRDWVDQDDLPIEQSTSFSRLPVLATAKVYLMPRGRTVGSLAWIPSEYAPYLGAGAGWVWYRFRQSGDFIDYVDDSVFNASLDSSGWTPAFQGIAGIDLDLTTRLMLTGEATYTRASGDLGTEFRDFDEIDLSGFAATVGISFRI